MKVKRKFIYATALLVVFLIAGVVYWWSIREERAVKKLITETAGWLSVKPRKVAHEGVLRHTRADEFFGTPLELKIGKPQMEFSVAADAMERYWMLYFREADQMTVETENIQVQISGDKADFSFDAQIDGSFGKKKLNSAEFIWFGAQRKKQMESGRFFQ